MLSRHKKLLKYLKSEKDYLLCPVLIIKPSDMDDFAASSFFSKNLRIDWYVRLGPVKNVMCVWKYILLQQTIWILTMPTSHPIN